MGESRTERQSPGTDYHETGGQISPLLGKAISENECLTCDFVSIAPTVLVLMSRTTS